MIDYSQLTPNQIMAVNKEGTNILVSAGAGSGKTRVLSLRVLRKLEDGVPLDKLVILTFTNLAANEMRQRIKDNIKLNQKLKNQLPLLDNAMISTFDAFALRIVKEYHYRLNLPKTISIADNVVLDKMRKVALEDTLKAFYLRKDKLFTDAIERLFDRDDEAFSLAVDTVAKNLETIPERADQIDKYRNLYFSETKIKNYVQEFNDLILNLIQSIKPVYERFSSQFHSVSNTKIKEYMAKMDAFYHDMFALISLDSLIRFFRFQKHPTVVSKSQDVDEETIEAIKSFHSQLRTKVKEIADIFVKLAIDDTSDIVCDILETETTVKIVMEVANCFLEKYESLKRKHSLFHFSDIMKYAIRLFTEHKDILESFRSEINEIMVDEYQDTNDLQEYLLNLLGHNNLFMVGDIKQSIYGFRNANPKNFLQKYHEYSHGQDGIVIDLLENFRSREEVLDFVNFVFTTMMDESIGGIDYQDNQALRFGLKAYVDLSGPNQDYLPEILQYDFELLSEKSKFLSKSEVEAIAIRNDILRKMEQKFIIFDPKSHLLRPVEYDDFAILVDRRTSFDLIQKTLVLASIPVEIYTDEMFSMSEEIQFVWQFVRLVNCLKNPETIAENFASCFLGVCRSFVYQKSDDALVDLFISRKFKTTSDIYGLKSFREFNKVIEDVEIINRLIPEAPLHNALEKLYEITDIYFHLAKLDNPASREAKLDFLYQKTVEFSGFDFDGFIDYLTTVYQNNNLDIEYQNSQRSFENTVKVSSMHKSKGLEYPICYYCGLDKKFNYTENKNLFIFDQTYGLVTKTFKNGFKNTILHTLLERKNYQEYVSERIRLFYVALTRAREKQILLLDASSISEAEIIIDASGYLDLDIRRKFRRYTDLLSHLRLVPQWIHSVDLSLLKPHTEYSELKETHDAFEIKHLDFDFSAISEVTYHKSELKIFSEQEKAALVYGSVLHETMEHFDFKNLSKSLERIDKQLAPKIRSLVSTKPFQDLENSQVYQEYPFAYKDGLIDKMGVIDLLIVSKNIIFIIDYKLKDITSEDYRHQLIGYKRYIETLTQIPVETYLYSFSDESLVMIGD